MWHDPKIANCRWLAWQSYAQNCQQPLQKPKQPPAAIQIIQGKPNLSTHFDSQERLSFPAQGCSAILCEVILARLLAIWNFCLGVSEKKTVTPCYPKIQGLILMFPLKRPESEDHSLILEHNKPAWQIFTRTVVFRAIACKGLTATKCKTTGPQWIVCLKQ